MVESWLRDVLTLVLFCHRGLLGLLGRKEYKVVPSDKNDDWCSFCTLDKCRETLSGLKSALWFSSPCAGGISWTHMNMHRGNSTVNKIKGHWAEFRKLWGRLEEIACLAIPHGVVIICEWPRGCRNWTSSNVVRFLEKYGCKFADFGGCMYGLVASHGKDADLPTKKPWRVAYLNSSLGELFNLKCDGSHEHSPCPGQNTSDTERYTPLIARAVHQCFGRDVKLHGVNCSDDVISIMPAAISVLKLPASNERDHWVDLLMASRSLKSDTGEWPLPSEASESPPRSRRWRKNRMQSAGWQDSPEQMLDEEEQEIPDVDFPMEKVRKPRSRSLWGLPASGELWETQDSSRSRATEGG